jgi:hypothetical protein
MRNFIIKLLFRDAFHLEGVDEKKLKAWLFDSYENKGYSQYYTMRKKFIGNLMGNGLSWVDYLICLGRLQELRSLNENIKKEVNIRKKKEKLISKPAR